MSRGVVSPCERSGLGAALRTGLLGGYDGFGLWQIMVDNVAGASEHLMVQAHEAMHHELQTSTVWGNLTAMAASLAAAGHRRSALLEIFDRAVELSTEVHELYATFMADALGAHRFGEDALADNPKYMSYRSRAGALVPVVGPEVDHVRTAAVAAVLRCCMQPAGLAEIISGLDFASVTVGDLKSSVSSGPDERLRALEAAPVDRPGWQRLLGDLAAQDPGHQRRILGERRFTTLADMPALSEQWEFERDVVQRRCYEFVAQTLASLGHRTLAWSALGGLTAEIAAAAVGIEPALATVVAVGDDIALSAPGDLLEFGRQGLAMRNPLPLERIPASEPLSAVVDGFVVQAGSEQEHVCGLWASPALMNKQFAAGLTCGDMAAFMFTRARTSSGEPVARVCDLPRGMTPRELQAVVAPRPLLVLTTLSTIVDGATRRQLETVEPVFVLLDLPIGWHVDHWVGQGATVRMAVATIDAEREIAMIALAVSQAPMFRFFHVGGLLALGSLIERLRQRHEPTVLRADQTVLEADIGGFMLAVSHVLHTFSVLDQNGIA